MKLALTILLWQDQPVKPGDPPSLACPQAHPLSSAGVIDPGHHTWLLHGARDPNSVLMLA